MPTHPVLIAGQWRAARATGIFRAENPATGEALPDEYPVSAWDDVDAALTAACETMPALRGAPPEGRARFLTRYAERIEARADEIVGLANLETALPRSPRLADVELPRTTNQLRQAAPAAVEGSWALPTIDTKLNIRSYYAPLGPVWVFGPNNFPFAFNSIAGGDFAAAIAAGNPVIAKANTSHPGTTRLLAEEALPRPGTPACRRPPCSCSTAPPTRTASGWSRTRARGQRPTRAAARAGLKLKAAADAAGKPIYLELSSVNPVVVLPGALAERGDKIAEEFTTSCLMGTGQFCTNPGLVVLLAGDADGAFVGAVRAAIRGGGGRHAAVAGVARVARREPEGPAARPGRRSSPGARPAAGPGYRFANTLLRVTGAVLAEPGKLQTEAFGNASLLVVAKDVDGSGRRPRVARRQPHRLHLLRHEGHRRSALRHARAARALPRRPAAQRQDAHRRGRQLRP